MKRSIFILLVVLFFLACNDKDYEQGVLPVEDKISIDKVEFHPTGGVVTFQITAKERWRVLDFATDKNSGKIVSRKWGWISISSTAGQRGTTKVVLTAGPAGSDISKKNITFEIDGEDINIPLAQERPFLTVSIPNNSPIKPTLDDSSLWKAYFDWYHGKDVVDDEMLIVNISSNTDWKVVPGISETPPLDNLLGTDVENKWLYCSKVKSDSETTDAKITFIPNNYNSGGKEGERTVTFRIIGYDDAAGSYGNIHTFSVTQPGLRFSVDEPTCEDKDQAITSLPPCNVSPINMTVDSEVDWFWSVLGVLNQKDEVKNVDENKPTTVTITIPTNATREPRKFDVTVTPKTGEFKDGKEIRPSIEYRLTQRAYVLEFVGHSQYNYTYSKLDNANTESHTVQLKSSGAWEIDESTIPEWLNVSSNHSGIGSEYGAPEQVDVKFNAKTRNYDEKDRSATVKVKSTEAGNTLETLLSVSQTKYVLSQPSDISLLCTDDLFVIKELNFESTGEWRLETVKYTEGEKDWLEFSENSSFNVAVDKLTGEGDGHVYYRANRANVSVDTDNVAHVRLVSVTHEKGRENQETDKELYRDFSITQRKFVFNVTPEKAYEEKNRFECKAVSDIYYYVDIDTSAGWEFDNSNTKWINERSRQNFGNGVIRFYIEVDNNTQAESRNGSFSIRSTHDETKFATFNVHQEGYVWKVEPVKFYDEFAAVDAPAQKINVTCSGTWRITNLNADAKAMISNWSTLSQQQQSGEASFVISNNYELQDREAIFTIQCDDNDAFNQKITFEQEAFVFSVQQNGYASLNFDALNPSSVTFTIDVSGEGLNYFDLEGLKSQLTKSGWFDVSKQENFSVVGNSITIKPRENYKQSSNSLDLIFRSANGGHTKTFTLTQKAFEFDNQARSLTFNASLTQQNQNFTLDESTGSWSVKKAASASWITVNPSSGSGYGSFTVTVEPYFTTTATTQDIRTETIYVESAHYSSNNQLRKQVTIKQSVYKLVVSELETTMSKDKDATGTINIDCTGDWKCDVVGDGNEFIKAEKIGPTTLKLTTLSANSGTTERTAVVRISTMDFKADWTPLTVDITVKQSGSPKK